MQVSEIYNRLLSFEKNKGSGQAYPIHKPLHFSPAEQTKGISDINDLIASHMPSQRPLRILDAGCGVGYSLLRYRQDPLISGLGISLSQEERQFAQETAHKQGVADRFQFLCKSYDEAFEETFDVIFAIESLKHAPDWRKSLQNLFFHLNPGGCLFLVEDFLSVDRVTALHARFQMLWSVPDLFTYQDISTEIQKQGIQLIQNISLSDNVIRKNALLTRVQEYCIRVISHIMPSSKTRDLLAIYQGGLIMDLMYAKKEFSYGLLLLQKPGLESDSERR